VALKESMMKRSLHLFALLVSMGCPAAVLAQQGYPSKPIRVISPFAAGGGNDAFLRTLAPRLTENLKQPIVVDTRAGANGIVGTELAARAAPDGYTLILIPSNHTVNASLYAKLPYDSIRDFTPVSLAGSSPLVVAVHPSLPAKNLRELIAFAKVRPGQLTYGSAGVGSSGHLAGVLFDSLTGTAMTHIPYKGMSIAITDLIGGQVSLTFGTSLSVVPQVRNGRLRALATTGTKRMLALPDVPTVAETGFAGYQAGLWYGFVGPARMPAEIVRRLNAEIVAVLALPEIRERLQSQGVEARSTTPDEFARLLVSDIERWAVVVKRAGLRAE
jgi:tripartite-type tricarboxylate transporter receptor subunit TctC